MHERNATAVGLAAMLMTLACARPVTRSEPSAGNVITARELSGTHATAVYDAIRALYSPNGQLRPGPRSWPGPSTLDAPDDRLPVAYVNDAPYGPLSSLRKIPTAEVDSVKLFDQTATGMKFGAWPDNWRGVIDVYTKK